MARKEVDEKRLQFAAHVFIFTTRDGMIISHLTHTSPLKLSSGNDRGMERRAPVVGVRRQLHD